MSRDEIEIHFPSKVPEDLQSVVGLSDAIKTQIAKKIEEGSIKIQSYAQEGVVDADDKIELILELLEERAKFDKFVTIEEVKEIMDEEENYLSNFVAKFMRAGRQKSLNIKKIKRFGKTVYKLQ
jgi:hypothetical protein